MKPISVSHVIACDDIRTEDNGKRILIGMYDASILVSEYPTILSLALHVKLETPPGSHDVAFKVTYEGQELTTISGTSENLAEHRDFVPVAFRVPPFEVRHPGQLYLHMSVNGGAFRRHRIVNVRAAPEQPGLQDRG